MVAETEVARFLSTCRSLKQTGILSQASIAKYYAAEAAVRTAQKAIKIHGAAAIQQYPSAACSLMRSVYSYRVPPKFD
jgi:alkylation response protein AidB-like acyl-CoA dehydrogenase